MAGGAKEAEAIVKDNGECSYTATYSVESRGDYQVGPTHCKIRFVVARFGLGEAIIGYLRSDGSRFLTKYQHVAAVGLVS